MPTDEDHEIIEPTDEERAQADGWEEWTDHRGDRDKDGVTRHPWRPGNGQEVQ